LATDSRLEGDDMIRIHDDFWREDCVAMVGIGEDDECIVEVLPVGGDEAREYSFDGPEEAAAKRDEMVRLIEAFMERG